MVRRATRALPALLLLGCTAPGGKLPSPAGQGLPPQVEIQTPREAIGDHYDVAVREGLLWIRPRDRVGRGAPTRWQVVPPDGRPKPVGFSLLSPSTWCGGFKRPQRITAVSVDGDNLLAVAADRRAFYAKLAGYTEEGALTWVESFGFLWMSQDVRLPEGYRAFAISHRGLKAGYYEDIDGNQHPMTVGVSTLYVLDDSGQKIRYADPWLEPDWTHLLYTPLRGRFVAINLSVSASTLFVIDRYGEMWTRLADYDSTGENPIPRWYSYARGFRDGANVRSLPGEPWRRQPPIKGRITAGITILQNGQGNAARELRVQGLGPQGQPGYYTKPIYGPRWRFVASKTLAVPKRDLLDNRAGQGQPLPASRLGPGFDHRLTGYMRPYADRHPRYRVTVSRFNPHNSPARVRIELGGGRIDALLHMRRVRPSWGGSLWTELGVLEVLPGTLRSQHWLVRRVLQRRFPNGRLLPVEVWISADHAQVRVSEDTWFLDGLELRLKISNKSSGGAKR